MLEFGEALKAVIEDRLHREELFLNRLILILQDSNMNTSDRCMQAKQEILDKIEGR